MGAFKAQTELSIAAIGGKDSMSGTFENIDVPPTLVSFTAVPHKGSKLITGEFKKPMSNVYLFAPRYDENNLPDFESVKKVFERVHKLMEEGKILSAYAVSHGGVAEAVAKMAFGNKIGFRISNYNYARYFAPLYGAIVVESDVQLDAEFIGRTLVAPNIIMSNNDSVSIDALIDVWEKPLEGVFPTKVASVGNDKVTAFSCAERPSCKPKTTFAKPKVIIPVFPGTNCEYDTYRRFVKAGADAEIFVLRNLTPAMLSESLEQFSKKIAESQILMLPGGFSGGDGPDGSGKFITAVLRNPLVKESVTRLIEERGGLVLGICNGFQALVKSGLLPYGRILDVMEEDSPTLTFNAINRHQSQMVSTRIASVKSPWLAGVEVGDIHTIAISHGEGRFTANESWLKKLIENGQIATQYVDMDGNPTMDIRYNPNASDLAIEGIFSPDGRIFGKMGHSERIGRNVGKNIYGDKDQKIFESGVRYFN